MKYFEKVFYGVKMTWGRVVLLSVITGAAVGLIMVPEFLLDTSFQQPGISFEFWIAFALFIALNCERPFEAGTKTFAAFVISQPIIYLVQVPFCWRGWDIMNYYIRWIIPTVLTLPGGIAAWYVKKGNWLSVFILAAADVILCMELPYSVLQVYEIFPKQIISTLFIAGETVFLTLFLIRDKKKRIVSFALAAAMLVLFGASTVKTYCSTTSAIFHDAEGRAPYELISDSDIFDVTFSEDSVDIEYRNAAVRSSGEDAIVYKDADGVQHVITITYGGGSVITDK